jgi:hypothetical protein
LYYHTERQRRREGTYTLVLLVVYRQGKEDHEPAVGLLRDVMVCVVLNHSSRSRRRMIIWARREWGRDTMELPQFEMVVRVEKFKRYPVNSYLVYPYGSVLILLDPVGRDQVNHEVSPTDFSTCWYNSVPLARIQSNQYFV